MSAEKGTAWLDETAGAFWRNALLCTNGKPQGNVANAITALSAAPELKGLVALDAFANKIMLTGTPPWESDPVPRVWADADDVNLQNWLQCEGVPIASVLAVGNAVQVVAQRNRFDPLADYLNGLKWDGVERLSHWLPDYTDCERTPLHLEIGRRFLISAVARALQPGCKVDHTLSIEGPQGIGKSQLVATLGGQWTQDNTPDLHSKDAAMSLAGRWFIELSELAAMSKSEVEHVKKFLTMQTDKFRPPYGRNYVEVPRRCVFVATTNESRYLRDPTGNRRFWPVACNQIHVDDLKADRDLLFAEAVAAFKAGEQWHITDPGLIDEAKAAQAERLEVDPWHEIIANEVRHRAEVTNRHLMELLEIPAERQTGGYAKRIGNVMRVLKWIQTVDQSGGERNVIWVREASTACRKRA